MKTFFVFLFKIIFIAPLVWGAQEWAEVTFVKGKAEVYPSGKGEALPLRVGTLLQAGDVIETHGGSRVTLLLSEGSIKVLTSHKRYIIGQEEEKGSIKLGEVAKLLSKTLFNRKDDNPMLKHVAGMRKGEQNGILFPHRTKVLWENLTFLWRKHPHVSSYRFTLMGSGGEFYETNTEETQLTLPMEKIKPNTLYFWDIQDDRTTNILAVLGSGYFTTLTKKETESVQRELEQIRQAFSTSKDDPLSPLFLTYQVYQAHQLYLNSLITLEKIKHLTEDFSPWEQMEKQLLELLDLTPANLPLFD